MADDVATAPVSNAAGLIGVKGLPSGLGVIIEQAREARAYNGLNPYPLYHYRDWKTEDRGPLPRCLPLAKSIVNRGAKWLFGRSPALTSANADFEKLLHKAWKSEKMPARLVAMARCAAVESGIFLKFSYDEDRKPQPLTIQTLSMVDEVRLFVDPHDCESVLMCRIQYRYYDATQGASIWYREEWTAEEEVHYAPIADTLLGAGRFKGDPDAYDSWVQTSRLSNPLGVIPGAAVKNFETDDIYGAGDCWDLYRVIDRINLTYHLMDRSNQFDSTQTSIFLDMELEDADISKPLAPGQGVVAKSDDGEDGEQKRQGKVIEIAPRGSLRPAMMDYAKDLKQQVLEAAGSVQIDQSAVSNKGNLTTAVLQQLYQPQIESTEEKRKSWADGLGRFFNAVAVGLSNLGVLAINEADDESYAVDIHWPSYFEMSQDEKSAFVTRIKLEETAGYITHERAIELIAQVEGIVDVVALIKELKACEAQRLADQAAAAVDTPEDPAIKAEEQDATGLKRLGGKSGE